MKNRFFTTSFLVCICICAKAQIQMPAAYGSTSKVSMIREWTALAPIQDLPTFLSRPVKDVKQSSQYFDALGRPIQTVVRQGSLITGGSATDIVTAVLYDDLGREEYKFLPFVASPTGGNTSLINGQFKQNPFQQDSAFNKTQFNDESYYYSQTIYEASPLSRPLEAFAPGDNWVGTAGQTSEGNRHSSKMKYWINTTTDSVRIWLVNDNNNGFGSYSTASRYAAGELMKNVTADEHNNQVIEFKDKEGKVVLKKVQLTAAADTGTGKGYTGWLCTYYIYDALNRLRSVIQPKGVELLQANSWDITSLSGAILSEQCFRYEYDRKGRMIMKKVPGAGAVAMVYDAKNRLVMTQDSSLRAAGKWFYTSYDSLNRPLITGLWTNSDSRPYHEGQAAGSTSYPSPSSNYEELTGTFYDDYSWRSSYGNPLSNTRSTSYDSYLLTASDVIWPYPQSVNQSAQLKGAITGSRTLVLGTSTYLYSVSFYDERGRVVQAQNTNISGGTDIITSQYAFCGVSLLSILKTEKSGTNSQTSLVLTKTTYDDLWRVEKIEKRVSSTKVNSGSMPSAWTVMEKNEYNALGQLLKKKLGTDPDNTSNPLETENFEYNIRGWILGMNRSYVKDTTSTTNWFGFDLGYDKTSFTVNGGSKNYAAAQYNGNITGMLWRSNGDDMLRKYDFTYDASNRLLSADFNQLNSNAFSKAALIDFSVAGLTYDANGNILSMNQKGWKLGGSVTIDSLLYTYTSYSNKLQNVIDRQNDTTTKLGDFRSSAAYMTALGGSKTTGATDYTYDPNGNLVSDKNKDITSISYNFLNLPSVIHVNGKGNIAFTYDAGGSKLKKVVTDSTVSPVKTVTTLYLPANFVNDTLQYISTEDGRIRSKNDTLLVYDYFIKDHLGNIRMVLTEERQTDGYPAASLETAALSTERLFYGRLDSGRVNKSTISGYPNDTYTNPNDYVQQLSGSGIRIGASIVLKVMAGDLCTIRVNSWWKSTSTPNSPTSPLSELLADMFAGVAGASQGHVTSSQLNSSSGISGDITNFLNSQNGGMSDLDTRPYAFLNWILFDEQFKIVTSGSGYEQVGADSTFTTHIKNFSALKKSGYLYIYVSNVTPNINVIFDNLQVTHIRGRLQEETHYYPFGLTMQGISSKALLFGTPGNKNRYNGKEQQQQEFSEGSGLEWLDFKYRFYDNQIGKFFCQDRLADRFAYMSPYQFCSNNPIWLREIDGLEGVKYTEVDNDGNKRTIVEKNVVVLTQPKKNIPAGATSTEIAKIEKQNQRIERNNQSRIESVKKELNTYFNGTDKSGVESSNSEKVRFRFNVTSVEDFNKKGMSTAEIKAKYQEISLANGIAGTMTDGDGNKTDNLTAGAAVITNEAASGGDYASAMTNIIRLNYNRPSGGVAHEVLHTLGLNDNGYQSGGLLNSPPEGIIPAEIDEVLKNCYDKK